MKKVSLVAILIMLLVGCGTAKKSNISSQPSNPFQEQVQKDLNNESARNGRFVPLPEAIQTAQTAGAQDNYAQYYLAQRYLSGKAPDTPENCTEAIKWAKLATNVDIKQQPLNSPSPPAYAQWAASLIVNIYETKDQCKDSKKLALAKIQLAKITKEHEMFEKRRQVEYDRTIGKQLKDKENRRQEDIRQQTLLQQKTETQHTEWLKSLTPGSALCATFQGTSRQVVGMSMGHPLYGSHLAGVWFVQANFEERNPKINKLKVLISKITARIDDVGTSIENSFSLDNATLQVGNSSWVDEANWKPCR
ncbi:MAG: hypothetical protein RL651_1455 [Pseudomonadota bacterium]|jgi:hypothetical protein